MRERQCHICKNLYTAKLNHVKKYQDLFLLLHQRKNIYDYEVYRNKHPITPPQGFKNKIKNRSKNTRHLMTGHCSYYHQLIILKKFLFKCCKLMFKRRNGIIVNTSN